jgi:hypothetical protein
MVSAYTACEEVDAGHIELEFTDAHGHVLSRMSAHNTVTENMKAAIASMIAGQLTGAPSYIALGGGGVNNTSTVNQNTDVVFNLTTQQQLAMKVPSGAGTQFDYDGSGQNTILLWMRRLGLPGGTATVEIRTDTAGHPDALVGTSQPIEINSLSTSYAWVPFKFVPSVPTVGASLIYHIVVLTSGGYAYDAGVKEFYWGADTLAGSNLEKFNGSVWSAYLPTGGAIFRVVHDVSMLDLAPDQGVAGELARKPITARSKASQYVARLVAGFTIDDAAGEYIGHLGMFDAVTGGNTLALANVGFIKPVGQNLNVYWSIGTNA